MADYTEAPLADGPKASTSVLMPGVSGVPYSGLAETARSFGQGLTFGTLDEIEAALRTGSISGPEYERQRNLLREQHFCGPGTACCGHGFPFAFGRTRLIGLQLGYFCWHFCCSVGHRSGGRCRARYGFDANHGLSACIGGFCALLGPLLGVFPGQ